MTGFDDHLLLGALPEAVVIADRSRQVVYLNPAGERLLGRPAVELLGRPLGELLPGWSIPGPFEGVGDGTVRHTALVRRDGLEAEVEVRLGVASSGGKEWLVASLRPRVEPGGPGLPVTAREAASEGGRRRLQAILDLLPIGVLQAEGPEFRLSIVNPASREIWGDIPEVQTLEELDRRISIFGLDGRRQDPESRPLGQALARGERVRETVRYRRPDGQEGMLELTAASLPGPGTSVVATYRDVTARARMEGELAERAAQFKALLDYLPVGVAYFDDQGICRASNGPARRILGRRRAEIDGKHSDELFAGASYLCEALQRCLSDREPHSEQSSPWPDPGGGEGDRFLDWRFEPLPPDPARSTGALALIVDVTDRKRAEDDLKVARDVAEQSARNKTRFLSAVSHDLRTPVNALSLLAELLIHEVAQHDDPRGDLRALAHDLHNASSNLIELINDLLDLTRFDSGDIEHQPHDFELETWLASAVEPLLLTARSKGLSLTWEVDRPGRVAHADRVKLGRVLTNLVGNAVKFTESGRVAVRAGATPEGWLSLSVSDTGPGIPDDQRVRIFDEFAQLRNPERDRTKGTGLGLAICKRLVEAVGGHLTLSTRLGVGSTFTALYPPDHLNEGPMGPSEPAAGPTAEEAPTRSPILLVEDDARSRRALTRLLERVGYNVEVAADGPQALEFLGRARPALVLLDLMMPGMDGLEVLRRIRAEPAGLDLPVVLLSGDVQERADDLAALGATEAIAKPVDFDALLTAIGRHIRAIPTTD